MHVMSLNFALAQTVNTSFTVDVRVMSMIFQTIHCFNASLWKILQCAYL